MSDKSPHNNPILKLSENEFPVVGVGASAGGLSAFKQFVGGIPVNSGMAYVLVQHLDPSHESLLSEILQKWTKVPVLEITNDIQVKPNHIYIIPSNKMLLANDGVLMLSKRPAPEKNKKNLPIDLFFKSLAIIHESHSMGVVLSGTGSDGTQGLTDIKSKGGITFAQDEASAEWPQMPKSAVNAGVVDFILPPSAITNKILELIKNKNSKTQSQSPVTSEFEETFPHILSLIRIRRHIDFTNYKQNTIKRRIQRRMVINKFTNSKSYLKFLGENPSEIDVLYQDLIIPVTSFFRDPLVFENLKQILSPILTLKNEKNEPIRVWVAGCSTGEEVYSLAICIHEKLKELRSHHSEEVKNLNGFSSKVQIFASDISEPAISFARKGKFKERDVENISPNRLQEYFNKKDGVYQVNNKIRESCVFAIHDFLKDPPFGNMDLISCRNVLIYFQPYLQKNALTTFHYSLKPDGYLLLGKSENVGSVPGYFTATDKKGKLFKKNKISESFMLPTGSKNYATQYDVKGNEPIPVKRTDFEGTADEILLKKYTSASIVVDEAMNIMLFRGSTSNYLEQQSGAPSHNLMKMAKPGLAFELRKILHKVKKHGKLVKKNLIYTEQSGARKSITVEAFVLPKLVDPHYLIVFQPLPSIPEKLSIGTGFGKKDEKDLRIRELEDELAQSREDMLSISQEQESVNEELQSANEEFMSGSEELQSLNEELETSKEELQSTNEELTVTNQELNILNFELTEERNFARAIINTAREPLIVLNNKFEVITSNQAFHDAFCEKLDFTEGKKLYELNHKQWDIPEVRKLLESILPESKRVENFEVTHNFKTIGERSLILNAMEIGDGTRNNLILLSIEDITQRKEMAIKLEDSLHHYKEMIYSSPSLIAVLEGPDYKISIANDPFINQLGKGNDVIGTSYLEAIPGLANQGLKEILKEVYETGTPRYVHEIPVKIRSNGKNKLFYYNFGYQAQRNSKGIIEGVAILANDVTFQAELNKKIKESEARFHQMADLTPEKIICVNTSGKIYYFNKSWMDFTGLSQKALVQKSWEHFMHPEELEYIRSKWDRAMKSGNIFEMELRLRDKKEDYKWHISRVGPVKDEDGKIKMWMGAITQIHRLKEEEERKEGFLKLASHELKTPITSIKGYTQLLLERLRETKEVLPESIPLIPSLERIDSQVSRLARLISEMLDLSRVQEYKLPLQKESFSLNHMVEESVKDIQYSSTEARVKINHQNQLFVKGDRDRINQVLINLITNSIKYSPNDQNIEVKVFQEGKNTACVSIEDHGIGINLEDQQNIFERFFRVSDKDEQTYSGLGIGLFLAKEIMIRHEGDIKVKSEKGKGSLFTFSLPLEETNQLQSKE